MIYKFADMACFLDPEALGVDFDAAVAPLLSEPLHLLDSGGTTGVALRSSGLGWRLVVAAVVVLALAALPFRATGLALLPLDLLERPLGGLFPGLFARLRLARYPCSLYLGR